MSVRKRPEVVSKTQSHETILLDLINKRGDMGIFKGDLKIESQMSDSTMNKALKLLLDQHRIKDVINIKQKGRKFYMGKQFEPSKELTGGTWYSDGKLDSTNIKFVGDNCLKSISKFKVASCEMISDDVIKKNKVNCTKEQINEILRSLVLDNKIFEVKSTGVAEYHSIPLGMVCYRVAPERMSLNNQGAMASIPCGVCPRISRCTPDGVISPKTCAYFQKWLDF